MMLSGLCFGRICARVCLYLCVFSCDVLCDVVWFDGFVFCVRLCFVVLCVCVCCLRSIV